eukprot:TRINITY_DN14400_c0_g1_i1.p1 TRINITY_DN14400_c0_g1~~TRINITY_DN14400_c0_g1_i1.p1  ORF type:complete len:322 (+),score=49.93 TRINITY_DN14400_c0_g1_i1:1314-2279(+)
MEFYSEREEWADIEPIPQDDGPNPVVPIAYLAEFRDVMDYFRAVFAASEMSERALALTADAIRLNAANYTVWHFRRKVLEALKGDLERERLFVNEVAFVNSKNYQLWHHRRWLAEKLGPSQAGVELEFTADVLEEDSKNYHAWSHRQWVLRTLGGWEDDAELHFCEKLLEEDLRNNSAWNQRFFVLKENPLLPSSIRSLRPRELHFVSEAIRLIPRNESPWRFLRGLYEHDWAEMLREGHAADLCREVLAVDPDCVFALGLFLDLLVWGLQPISSDRALLGAGEDSSKEEIGAAICGRLEYKLDPIRSRYWAFRRMSLSGI